tara:strand:+ start:26282 stop:27046 length:765 start_codon:yes stop_codon:yes gene_type:complete
MKIIMLSGGGKSSRYVYNALAKDYSIQSVLIPRPTSKWNIIKRRVSRLGVFKVFNILLFQLIVVNFLKIYFYKIITKIEIKLGLVSDKIPDEKIINLEKLNSPETVSTLKRINPRLIIVNGTSIISSKVLNSIDGIFINTHVGITPQYRGVHGGYWAIRNGDSKNFGVTIHLVDKGVDTGSIIYQKTSKSFDDYNFLTYPLIQYHIAIPLLKQAINDFKNNKLNFHKKENVKSRLYYHPTITNYLYGLIFKGIK